MKMHAHRPLTLLLAILLLLFLCILPTKSENVKVPNFAFSWLGNNDTFAAGDVATIKVKVLGEFQAGKYKHPFGPNITVNDKIGNSSYVSGVSFHFDGDDVDNWSISFIPIMVGLFNVLISDDHFNVFDSSLHFRVTPGPIYPSCGVVSWKDQVDEFVAGTKAQVLILPKDAFGNNASSASQGPISCGYKVFTSNANGSLETVLNFTCMGCNKFGYLGIEFIVTTAGSLLLHVEESNQTLNGSPLPFEVKPGPLDVSSCVLHWKFETKSFQLFSVMEAFIHQHDRYGNLVPGFYAFDVEVLAKGTNLSIPIADLQFKEVAAGVQSFTFTLEEPGNFMLIISDWEQNYLIPHMPYDFTVFIGYCEGMTSVINGSGLNHSVAGEVARFSVFLKDAYQYPAPIEVDWLSVHIGQEFGSYFVHPTLHPIGNAKGNWSTEELNYESIIPLQFASVTSADTKNTSVGNWTKASDFDVIYTPEKSGLYEIGLHCGNIPLNGGHPFRKEVSSGDVNVSLSGVVQFAPKVPKLSRNEIVVQLMDSFFNPVMLQQSKLELEIASINKSGFSIWPFVETINGSYTGWYLAEEIGTYEICASFDGNRFLPCPFGVHVYDGEYFPKAYNDIVAVWEGESIAFDALQNDYFAGGNASIVEFSKPSHGSLIQYGRHFRYTPYRGFSGNDSFSYVISDANGNLASGAVNISVLSIPPQFVSFPSQLQATEDVISPKFGGFQGLEIVYSDKMENILVAVNAHSGSVLLSPMLMQFWQPTWNHLTVKRGDGKSNDLILEGCLEVINFALQSIQYLGNENFSGDDKIRVSTMNNNGINYVDVPVFVEPINDPPFINVPEFIILEKNNGEGFLIFDRRNDKFDFFISDPDLLHFPGGESHFLVIFSVEVNTGVLSTKLPAELVNTTEVKLKNSYQWQPLQTFVTISKHFTVKAKGIRFRGTVNDCNSILQQLTFYGGDHGAVLTVRVNDLGNYGCYPDCEEMMSMPLFSEANVNILRRQPMSSFLAHALGSAIVIGFIVMFALSVILLFFMCKCAIVLVHEKRRRADWNIELSSIQNSNEQTSSTDLSENVTHFTGCCSSPFLQSAQPSKMRKRSFRQPAYKESGNDTKSFPQFAGDQSGETPLPASLQVVSGNG